MILDNELGDPIHSLPSILCNPMNRHRKKKKKKKKKNERKTEQEETRGKQSIYGKTRERGGEGDWDETKKGKKYTTSRNRVSMGKNNLMQEECARARTRLSPLEW